MLAFWKIVIFKHYTGKWKQYKLRYPRGCLEGLVLKGISNNQLVVFDSQRLVQPTTALYSM